jgi:enolase-phosphatase E1
VTVRLADRDVAAVLLDIEGTTTPIAFVHEVLFPAARQWLAGFLDAHADDAALATIAEALAREHAADRAAGEDPPAWEAGTPDRRRASVDRYARWLMDRDRKSPGLKALQGLLWDEAYRAGSLRGQVFDDVPRALRRWREAGIGVAVYSSGSELAQRRLFESTSEGNLAGYFTGFFDTAVGAKVDTGSYAAITRTLDLPPGRVLFVSDVTRELAAARAAGLQTVLSLRPGNPPQPEASDYEAVRSFDEIV